MLVLVVVFQRDSRVSHEKLRGNRGGYLVRRKQVDANLVAKALVDLLLFVLFELRKVDIGEWLVHFAVLFARVVLPEKCPVLLRQQGVGVLSVAILLCDALDGANVFLAVVEAAHRVHQVGLRRLRSLFRTSCDMHHFVAPLVDLLVVKGPTTISALVAKTVFLVGPIYQ